MCLKTTNFDGFKHKWPLFRKICIFYCFCRYAHSMTILEYKSIHDVKLEEVYLRKENIL